MSENGELRSLGSEVIGLPCLKWEHHTHRVFKNKKTDKRNIEDFASSYGVVVMAAGGYVMNNIDSGYNEF